MQLFFTPDITGSTYTLNQEESRHCQKVLRLREGDSIHLTDGHGTLFEARITDSHSKNVVVEVTEKIENYGIRPFKVHLAVAPTKNIDRFEWFLEKATEIGIDEITPLLCDHSERKQVRIDRLEKVIVSALKQSLKAYLPVLNPLTNFTDFIFREHTGQLFIAHLEEQNPVLLGNSYKKGMDVTILIGPEGDFSEDELQTAVQSSYKCVSLGNSRLRTETAALVACHTINLLNQ